MNAIDDCWNRIGVQGDGSCTELRTHIHCRNCSVYSAAARKLLDVPLPADHVNFWTKHFARPRATREHNTESVLIFRCAAEWLALPTALCLEVASSRPIRSLPHRRDPCVLGIANVRGELIVCVSLAALLGLQPVPGTGTPRLLIIQGESEPTALHVDEVHGALRYNPQDLRPLPDTIAATAARNTHATLQWRDRTVGVLESKLLLAGVDRCLA